MTQINEIFHHNMPLREAIKIAKQYGFNVENKHRHGEVVFTHPKLNANWTISNNKSEIGRGFLSWAKPIFETEVKEDNSPSFQHKVAKIVAQRTRENKITTADHVLTVLEYQIPRKKASDTLVHLYKKDLASREDIGVYFGTETLLNLIPEEKLESEPRTEVEAENEAIPAQETASLALPEKPQEVEEVEYLKTDNIVSRFEEKLEKLDRMCNRLENILKRFEETEEMKEVVEMFNEILEKRKDKTK